MKQKKIIERNLPLTSKYKMLSISRSNLFDFVGIVQICDNCNASIVNMATIQNETGKTFTVGLDCMKTLTKSLVNISDYEFELYAFNSTLCDYALMQSANDVLISDNYIQVKYTNKNGEKREKVLMRHIFENYKFDLSKFRSKLTPIEKEIKSITDLLLKGNRYVYKENGNKFEIRQFDKIKLYENDKLMRILDNLQLEKLLERILTK